MIKSKKQMYLVIGVFALVLMLFTTTYAFFNYTRTGTANTIRVGRVSFNTTQGPAINLTNVFPISRITAGTDTTNVGEVVVTITGYTDYNDGVEYLITATGVTNTVNSKVIPISVLVTPSAGLGTASAAYYSTRNNTNKSIYKVEADDTINNNSRLVVGYIKQNTQVGTASGINGTVSIKAFIDEDLVAISDTYDGTESDNMGTTTEWVDNRVVLTTSEWNNLQTNGVSFQVKVEANEGIWVKEQIKYNANGGTVNPSYKEIDDDATTYGTLAVPERSGYTFDGWYTEPVNGTEVTASTTYTQGTSVTTLYAHWSLDPICVRATTLHTEICSNGSSSYNNFCYADKYYVGGAMNTTTITYGNLGTSGNAPAVGDAFDCDVNGDGNYTERFYYVSPYYNTNTLTFDDTTGYATLIYYSNTINGVASLDGSSYYSSNENWHGPVAAKVNLPTTSQWSNITLKNTERAILACNNADCSGSNDPTTTTSGGTLPLAFSYLGYAARLLTVQEIKQAGCAELSGKTSLGNTGSLKSCNFLMEGTKYANNGNTTYGPWLETPLASNSSSVLDVYAYGRYVNYHACSTNYGARPAIDIPYSRIAY